MSDELIGDELIMEMKTVFEREFARYPAVVGEPGGRPSSHELDAAIQYVLSGRGKRVRPLIAYLATNGARGDWRKAHAAAVAIELIHTYSLIHDDLPCMDDDDLRRGRPTVHREFSEATALLVGDALLTDAFTILANCDLASELRCRVIAEIASAAGSAGMIRGQSLDLYWTNRESADWEEFSEIHTKKTGMLFGAAAATGAMIAGASDQVVQGFRDFGRELGFCFQVIDDVLDSERDIGKTPGKDEASNKLTSLKFWDPARARSIVQQSLAQSKSRIIEAAGADERLHPLFDFCENLSIRRS